MKEAEALLLPCPLCGGSPIEMFISGDLGGEDNYPDQYPVRCTKCTHSAIDAAMWNSEARYAYELRCKLERENMKNAEEPKALACIFDLDGTLSNCTYRRELSRLPNWKIDFGIFNKLILEDKPNNWCAEILNRMLKGYRILIVTGREDTFMKETKSWLQYYHIPCDGLIMRKAKDYRPDHIIKRELYEQEIKPYYDVLFVIDDRKSVVDMWRSLGLTCLQCAEGDF